MLPLALALAPLAGAITPNVFFNISLHAQDPLVSFTSATGNTSVWMGITMAYGVMGPDWRLGGASSMTAEGSDAPLVELEYPGTHYYPQGDAVDVELTTTVDANTTTTAYAPRDTTNSSVAVSSDDTDYVPPPNPNRLLPQELEWGTHQVSLAATGAGSLTLGSWASVVFNFTTGMQTEAADFESTPVRDEFAVVNGSASAFFNQTGTFNVTNLDDKWGMGYSTLHGEGALSATLPPNTSYVILNGTTGGDHGSYTVTLDPAPPLGNATYTRAASFNNWPNTTYGATLFVAPLDPAVQYKLEVASSEGPMGIQGVRLYSGLKDGNSTGNTTMTGKDSGEVNAPSAGYKTLIATGPIIAAAAMAVALLA